MVEAVRYARESGLPFFGVCLGLQGRSSSSPATSASCRARNSTEFEPDCGYRTFRLLHVPAGSRRSGRHHAAGRLSGAASAGQPGARAYGATEISERHRHRWKVSNAYRERAGGTRAPALGPVARRQPGGDRRAAGTSLVPRVPVPSLAQVASDSAAIRSSPLSLARRGGSAIRPRDHYQGGAGAHRIVEVSEWRFSPDPSSSRDPVS